jgi:cytochrome c553
MKISIQLLILWCVLVGQTVWASGDIEAGKSKSAACAACHGADGNSMNPAWPKLAGQGAPYVYSQLMMFKDGTRQNALMAGQAAGLSEQDMHDLAAYYASLTGSPSAADPELVEQGESIYRGGIAKKEVAACMACHSPSGAGNPAAQFPKLSGQHAAYTAAQLKAYRGMERNYPSAQIMVKVAERMTDAEIQAVAEYIAGLH